MVRRTVIYLSAWLTAGLGAITLGSAAVAMVGNQVTGDRPAPLTASEVRTELATSGPFTTTTTVVDDAASIGVDPPSDPATPTTLRPARRTAPMTVAAPIPPSGDEGGDGPESTTSAAAVTRTYLLSGGTARLRFEPSGVTVMEATPKPGFEVTSAATHDNGWRVEFISRSGEATSRVTGWWDDGPRDEVDNGG